jgi:hypothetical protein
VDWLARTVTTGTGLTSSRPLAAGEASAGFAIASAVKPAVATASLGARWME